MTMLDDSPRRIGELIEVAVSFDPSDRAIEPHPKLLAMLEANRDARNVFDALAPSRQMEIVRYIDGLKSEESVDRNVRRARNFLLGNGRFVGRDRPLATARSSRTATGRASYRCTRALRSCRSAWVAGIPWSGRGIGS